jgi:hypothetical protein
VADSRRPFALVRPHPGLLRRRVLRFVADLGYEGDEELVLPAGVPDGEAAVWVRGLDVDLLVLPFHVHRDRHGDYVDGTGVATLLAEEWTRRGVPILMPVSRFSWSARFPRRLEELRARRPEVARLVVPMTESQAGDDAVRQALAEIASGGELE